MAAILQPFFMLSLYLPYSKSEINRLFILAFQAKQDFVIQNFSFCDDTKVIYDFYHQIHTQLNIHENNLLINSNSVKFSDFNSVNIHQAGTAFRFLLSLCSILPYNFQFMGHDSLSKRPIQPLISSLSQLGISFEFGKSESSLPISFSGMSNLGVDHIVFYDKIISSQFLTSLLLLGPSLPLNFKIIIKNDEFSSESYVIMTLKMMEKLGVIWDYINEENTFVLTKNTFDYYTYTVSADWTNASYFIALSCILKTPIILPNLSIQSFQPDVDQLFYWTELGVEFSTSNELDLEINPKNFELIPYNWDFSSTPDLFQTFAALSAYQKGKYTFSGLDTLKYKETHRLLAIKNEFEKVGILMNYDENLGICEIINDVDEYPSQVFFKTYHDHRMAMSLSLLKPLIKNIQFDDLSVVSKSFPNYWIEFGKFFC